jgi:hypothetical protein
MEPRLMHYPLLIVILLTLYSGNVLAEADGPKHHPMREEGPSFDCTKADSSVNRDMAYGNRVTF